MMIAPNTLRINASDEIARLEHKVRDYVREHNVDGVIMGLSGGIDSAVVATLAVRALGADRVRAWFLYDRDSGKASMRRARSEAERLGIDLQLRDIEPEMRKRGIYKSTPVRIATLSNWIGSRVLPAIHRMIFGEPPFVTTLRRGASADTPFKRYIYRNGVGAVENAFNARHVFRREFLEARAREANYLPIGGANRSEFLTGWFVHGGVDDLPHQPLLDFYKTQVRQLARTLEIPDDIREQKPSPNMLSGLTDEEAIGIAYETLDLILYGLERDYTDEQIAKFGVNRRQTQYVRLLNELSSWKRENAR